MRVLLLVAFMLLTACGVNRHVDPELQPLLDEYLAKAPNPGRIISLRSLKMVDEEVMKEDGIAGRCDEAKTGVGNSVTGWLITGKVFDIWVSRKNYGSAIWRSTVFHELGHCLHKLEHVEDRDAIMFPIQDNSDREAWWAEHLDSQLAKLFEQIGKQ